MVGFKQNDAQAAITAAGLTVGSISQDHRCLDFAGNVIMQSPASGIYPVGTPVDLTVANALDPHGKECVVQ